jgi:hypothetical protein
VFRPAGKEYEENSGNEDYDERSRPPLRKRAMISQKHNKQKGKKKRQPADHPPRIVKADCWQNAARQKNQKNPDQRLPSEAHSPHAMQLPLARNKQNRHAEQLAERCECFLARAVEPWEETRDQGGKKNHEYDKTHLCNLTPLPLPGPQLGQRFLKGYKAIVE